MLKVAHTTHTVLFSIGGKNVIVNHINAKTAFFNRKLSETIFMKQPQGFQDKNNKLAWLKTRCKIAE